MNSSDNNYINALSNTNLYIYRYILPVIYILGNAGNLISAFIFSKRSWKKNVCVFYFNIYLLYSSCYTNSGVLSIIFFYGYDIYLTNSNAFLCKLYFYVAFLFAALSPTVLILASIDRLLISSQNVDTRLYSSKRLAYFSTSISTCFWIVFNSHTLFKVSIQQYYPSVYICYYDLSTVYINFVSYSLLIISVVFCCLMILLPILAFKNVRHIRIVARQQRNQIRSMTKKDFQLLRCLFAHDLVFIGFCLWSNMYYVYSTVTRNQAQGTSRQAIDSFLNEFLSFFYYIFFCSSFFIFVSISKAFRHELKRSILKIVGKQLAPMREEENKQENIDLNVITVNSVVS